MSRDEIARIKQFVETKIVDGPERRITAGEVREPLVGLAELLGDLISNVESRLEGKINMLVMSSWDDAQGASLDYGIVGDRVRRKVARSWAPSTEMSIPEAATAIFNGLQASIIRAAAGVDRSKRLANWRNYSEGRDLRGAHARAYAAGERNLEIHDDGAGAWLLDAPLDLVDNSTTAGGNYNSKSPAFRLWSRDHALVKLTAPGHRYVIGDPAFKAGPESSHGTLTNQNTRRVLEGFRVEGPGLRSGTVAIGLANNSDTHVRNVRASGVRSIVALHAGGKGGCQGNVIENANTYDFGVTPHDAYGYDFNAFLANCVRAGFELYGGRHVAGKVQDTRIQNCNVNNFGVTGIDTRGYGDALSDIAYGGVVNLIESGNRFYSDASCELVTSTVHHADDAHTIYLLKTQVVATAAADMYVDCPLRIRDASYAYYYSWIVAFEDAGLYWKITVASDFPFVPAAGLGASITYGDAEARAAFLPEQLAHVAYFEWRSDTFWSSNSTYSELLVPLVAHNDSNRNFGAGNPCFNVKRGRGMTRVNGKPFMPGAGFGAKPFGPVYLEANVHAQSVIASGDPDASNLGEFAWAFPVQNLTGMTLTHGMSFAFRSSDYMAGAPANYNNGSGNGNTTHGVVWAPGDISIPPDAWFYASVMGRQKMLAKGNVSAGQVPMSQADGTWIGLAKSSLSTTDICNKRGEFVISRTGSGNALVMAWRGI